MQAGELQPAGRRVYGIPAEKSFYPESGEHQSSTAMPVAIALGRQGRRDGRRGSRGQADADGVDGDDLKDVRGAVGQASGSVRRESRHRPPNPRPSRAAIDRTLDDVIRDWGAAVTHWRSPRERGRCVAGNHR